MQYRIGDRDPVTGLYDVIHPDGSFTRNGIKIFNSAHEFGDVVLATQRSDGMMILDGVKATLTEVVNTSFTLGRFGEKPVGYLAGQVFNNEEEVILPVVLIEFAPGSPTELEPGAGDFVVRIKIDRPQRKDLRVKCKFTGTAESGDYTYTGLDGDIDSNLFAVIPAGELFFDVVVTPIDNQSGVNQTVAIEIIKLRDYRIGQDNIVTATILGAQLPLVSINFAPGSATRVLAGSGFFTIRASVITPVPVDLDVRCLLSSVDGLSFADFQSDNFYTGLSASPRFIIPANSVYVDLVLTPIANATAYLSKTLFFELPENSDNPAQYESDYNYFDLVVVNASIFVAKYRPYTAGISSGVVTPRSVHAPRIFASNTFYDDLPIEITPGTNNPSFGRGAKLPTDLTLIPYASVGDSSTNRLRLAENTSQVSGNRVDRPARFFQFDLKLAKAALDAVSLRYLYVFIGGWSRFQGTTNPSDYDEWGTHSVQIVANRIPGVAPNGQTQYIYLSNMSGIEPSGSVPYKQKLYDLNEYNSDYVTILHLPYGSIVNQYLRITSTSFTGGITYVVLTAFCVRIDMQDLAKIAYVNPIPISQNPSNDQADRSQLVNY